MSLQIGKAIYNILSNNTNLTERVDTKIYPLVADNGTTFPFIVYKRLNVVPATSKDKFIYSELSTVQVVIASDNYNDSIEIAELVQSALQGQKGIFDGIKINNIEYVDASEDFIDDTFIQNITFNIYG